MQITHRRYKGARLLPGEGGQGYGLCQRHRCLTAMRRTADGSKMMRLRNTLGNGLQLWQTVWEEREPRQRRMVEVAVRRESWGLAYPFWLLRRRQRRSLSGDAAYRSKTRLSNLEDVGPEYSQRESKWSIIIFNRGQMLIRQQGMTPSLRKVD